MIFLISLTKTTVYFRNNATREFNYFKGRYHKIYKNSTYEENALKNFVKNLNKVSALNENSKDSDTILVLNKYADRDTDNFEEHYSINIVPCKLFKFLRIIPKYLVERW